MKFLCECACETKNLLNEKYKVIKLDMGSDLKK